MKIIKLNSNNIIEGFTNIISQKQECCVYGIPDGNFIYKGRGNVINEKFAKKYNIKSLDIPNEGGTIVISDGDLDIGVFKIKGYTVVDEILNCAIKYLQTKIDGIYLDGNDIILEENGIKYKFGSGSSVDLGGEYIYTAIHFSVNINLELIKGICLKEMKKVPRALSEFGINGKNIFYAIKQMLEEI